MITVTRSPLIHVRSSGFSEKEETVRVGMLLNSGKPLCKSMFAMSHFTKRLESREDVSIEEDVTHC